MIWNQLKRYEDVGLLILRLGVGIAFIVFHGWRKIAGGPEAWAQTGGAMDAVGIGFGHTFFGFLAAFAESVGGLCIALGLFFRPACLLVMLTMIVATNMHVVTGRGGPAHALKNAFFLFGLFFVGPGKYSLDALLTRRRTAAIETDSRKATPSA